MADKSIFVRIVRLMNFLCALAMIGDAIWRVFDFHSSTDPFFFLLTFYLIGFATLLVMAEMRYKKVIVYLEFLKGRIGKGLYVILLGLLIFDENRKPDMFLGIALVLVGILNIIVGCMRETVKEDEPNAKYYEKANLNDTEVPIDEDPEIDNRDMKHQRY